MRRIGIVFVLLVTATAACASSRSSTATKPSGSTSTTNPLTAVRRVVRAGLLRASDVPGAVVSPRPVPTGLSDGAAQKVPSCADYLDKKQGGFLERHSRRFAHNGVTMSSTTSAYSTSSEVAAQLDLGRDPATVTCLGDLLRKLVSARVPATTKVNSLSVSPISVNAVGDDVSALRVTTALTVGTQPTTELTDLITVQVGRYRLTLDVDASTTAQLAAAETTLLPKLVARMQHAGA